MKPWLSLSIVILTALASPNAFAAETADNRPNILLAIADDWSWPHAGAYGSKFVRTPAFDRVAKQGVLFSRGYCASPGCSPSRAALLTGRHTWQIESAGTHASSFPTQYQAYPDLLEAAGYFVGHTGKGWGPGNVEASGRTRNPAGPAFSSLKFDSVPKGVQNTDYAGNFAAFLGKRPKDKPFCFWYGGKEPHRAYEQGSGLRAGKKLADAEVPAFLPDTPEVRSDLLDYAMEVEWFDQQLAKMLTALETAGELENTLIVVTGDDGMPFPRAKANCYDAGIHVPMAICWGARVKGGRTIDDPVGFVDLAPTFLAAAGLARSTAISGRSLLELLVSEKSGTFGLEGNRIFSARERHSSARVDNLGYPCRAMVSGDYLYIRNFAPDRWPAGDPRGVEGDSAGFYDIDGSPTKKLLTDRRDTPEIRRYFELAMAKRPAEELFDLRKDPSCLENLAAQPAQANTVTRLRGELEAYLKTTGDPRVLGNGEIWETYPRYSPIRKFE